MYVTIDFVESIPIQPVAHVKNVQLLRKNHKPSSDLEVEPQNEPQVNFQCCCRCSFSQPQTPPPFLPATWFRKPESSKSSFGSPVPGAAAAAFFCSVGSFALLSWPRTSAVPGRTRTRFENCSFGMILKEQEEDVTKKSAMQKLCI